MSHSAEKKSARKFWWIIMILPIGLVIGSITSVINHLRQDEEAKAQLEFQVAVALNAQDIEIAMDRASLLGKRSLTTEIGRKNTEATNRFIQGSVSPGGTGIQFTDISIHSTNNSKAKLSYADISGVEKNKCVAIVIELVADKNQADLIKLAISPSIIRSLSEAKPSYSLRFVLTPETLSAQQHAQSLQKNIPASARMDLHKVIVLKEQKDVALSDPNDWKIIDSSPAELATRSKAEYLDITHPILRQKEIEAISPELSKATLKAADQLRSLILRLAN